MGIFENIKIAIEGLRLNKMRSFLTMLGIIIGIASVIAIVTIGDALSNSVSKGFESFGANTVMVMVMPRKGHEYNEISSKDRFHISTIEAIQNRYQNNIKSIVMSGSGSSGKLINGKKNTSVNADATSPGAKDLNNVKMITGRFLEDKDIIENKEVAIISDKAVKELYDDNYESALGQIINFESPGHGSKSYTIVGVYKHEPISFGMLGGESGSTTSLYIPYTVGNRQFAPKDAQLDYYSNFAIIANTRDDITFLTKEIADFYENNYYKDNDIARVETSTVKSQLNEINNVMGTISMAIGGIAAISLLVGGIGVMNILLVSVTERTREIGIRKALGATNRDIRTQFIIESVIICIIGGIIGLVLGGLSGYVASVFLKSPTLPSVIATIIAVSFSMFIGIFFGYYPANKAAMLNPIDALRHE